jgi:hypothetical protein
MSARMNIRILLAQTRMGRVLLHSACLARRPANLGWHWKGIIREFCSSHRCAERRNPWSPFLLE